MTMYRQGDILVISTDSLPDGLTEVPRDDGRVILAYGEVTGHAHAIGESDVHLLEGANLEDRFLQVLADGGCLLVHDEHASIRLPAGNYIVRRQREYSPEAIRRVAD